jgi:hypothetical protein
MTFKLLQTAEVINATGDDTTALSSLFTLTATSNPAYLVVTALDRNEYMAGSSGATGSFSGNGNTLQFGSLGAGTDGRGAGIVFTWQASTRQYVNATYGSLSQLGYTISTNTHDVTNISFFGATSLATAQQYASNAYAMMQVDASGYLGSTTFVTDPNFAGTVPAQATPDSIAATALSMVGQAWNDQGCWTLASTIAAESGAGLPVQSTALQIPGVANGEWTVVYNGPSGASSNWASLVTTGDVVVFASSASSGHITTCVSGTGATAMLVDNITYVGQNGAITNSANDGSANDVTIQAPHLASQEFAGLAARNVVIYALDTPVITDKVSSETIATNGTVALSTLFAATDPAHKSITSYQVYDTSGAETLLVGKTAQANLSETSPLTVNSLSTVTLLASAASSTDTLDVRASNGTYWGDWQSLAVTALAPPPKPPTVGTPTPAQTWQQGTNVTLKLPATLFKDPQNSALTYSASGTHSTALPSWLSFDPSTNSFSGAVPAGLEKFSVVVTATDALGASASETFTVTVPAAAPKLTDPFGTQHIGTNSAFSFALPSDSFTDPQGQALTLKATLASGAALPSWLIFTAASGTFSGTSLKTTQTVQVKVTATDTGSLSASETFAIATAPATGTASGFSLADWSPALSTTLSQNNAHSSGVSVSALGALGGLLLDIGHHGVEGIWSHT